MSTDLNLDEDAIRTARASSNLAIVNKDIDGIAASWANDILVLSSTSAHLVGARANRHYYLAQFTRRPDTLWVRTPTVISVLQAWNMALEEGDWVGSWTDPDGPVELRGRYTAQWRRLSGTWRIQGEIYVPVSCDGGLYCSKPPEHLGTLSA